MTHWLRVGIEAASLIISLTTIVITARLVSQMARMSEASLSTFFFLRARVFRRFLMMLAVAVVLFVVMPTFELVYLLSDTNAAEVVHDVGHLTFVALVLIGVVALSRASKVEEDAPVEEEDVESATVRLVTRSR